MVTAPPAKRPTSGDLDGQQQADRSGAAKAYSIATKVMTIAIGMSLPGFLGWWADDHLGTTPWVMMGGFAFGFWYGLWRLMNLSPRQP